VTVTFATLVITMDGVVLSESAAVQPLSLATTVVETVAVADHGSVFTGLQPIETVTVTDSVLVAIAGGVLTPSHKIRLSGPLVLKYALSGPLVLKYSLTGSLTGYPSAQAS
jgi:hypothetical protein